jgi:argininosuccinate synthase
MTKIVLAYSGDLATSLAIVWLAEHFSAEVATLTLDLGGGGVDGIRDRALALGAARAHVIDGRNEFATAFVLPALQANALGHGRAPLGSALARPLIAKHLVNMAAIEGATVVAHAGLPHGLPSARLTTAARAINPAITVVDGSGVRANGWPGMVEYAKQRGIPIPPAGEFGRSTDANVWGRTLAGGALDDLSCEVAEDLYASTKAPADAPEMPAYVELEFDRGVPVGINGVPMPLVELIESLDTIAGTHGIGRLDVIEERSPSVRSRRIHEAPAAVALHLAHEELQRLVTSFGLYRLTSTIALEYAAMVQQGDWYSSKRGAMDALIAHVQQAVTGMIRLKLHKGRCDVAGRWEGQRAKGGGQRC